MEELQRLKDELLRLGLHETLEIFDKETHSQQSDVQQSFLSEAIPEVESPLSQSPPRIESCLSETCLAPLTIAQPVTEQPPPLLHTASAGSPQKSPNRSCKASPHFTVIPVQDQMKFRLHEISNKALSEKSNYEEYPPTPLSFSAVSSTSKASTAFADPPTSAPSTFTPLNPFTWDLSDGKQQEVEPASPGVETPQQTTSIELDEAGQEFSNDSPIRIPRSDSFSRVDSLNGSQDIFSSALKAETLPDRLEDVEDNGTIVSLPESEPSPFAGEFVFTPPEPPQDSITATAEDPNKFSFPQTPQGSDAGSGGALNALRSFNSTRSNDFLSCGTNSSKTAKSPFGLELSSADLTSRMEISQSSGEMGSPAGSEVPVSLPPIFNPLGTQKRVSLSLNACGYDWEAILNDIRGSKAPGTQPTDSLPEDLWMKRANSKDNKSADYLLPRYTFSQSYIDETYDRIDLKIYHKRGKTGFESNKDLYVEMGDIIAGRYQVIKVVGSAVFSKAIKAVDLKLNKSVCLKMVKNVKDYFDQSLDEIKLLRYLNRLDPNDEHGIVRLLDFFYYREHLFLVFELLRHNLYEVQQKSIKEHGTVSSAGYYFSTQRIKSVAKQVLTALSFLHSKNIIHSDLKPENVLIKNMEACTVKVIDLGSSCFVTDFLGSYVQSRSYRAPEVILGVDYDQKIDVWSLGCMLVELFTGSVLFQSTCLSELLVKIESVRGPMPSWMLCQGKFSTKYYTTSMKIFRKNPTNHEFELLSPDPCGLSEILKMADDKFVNFVSLLLTTDPTKRPAAEEMLKHPWLMG